MQPLQSRVGTTERMGSMRTIAIEEHCISQAMAPTFPDLSGRFHVPMQELLDIGDGRIKDMDEHGIDVQVLSHTQFPVETIDTAIVRASNDELAGAVERHPARFAAFASLPMAHPDEAADELQRTVSEYGFKGAMINGTTGGLFLDDPRFDAVLASAVDLGVALYLHPGFPPPAVADVYYGGIDDTFIAFSLSTTTWGWHSEVGLHILRMISAGVFDRHPQLQVVIGHLGEMIPFMWERIETWLGPAAEHLELPVLEYFPRNLHVTTSGFTTNPPFQLALEVFGVDRMIFSVDYPFSPNRPASEFLRNLPVPDDDKVKIAGTNVATLLELREPVEDG